MQPDFIVTSRSVMEAYQRLLRTNIIRTIGNYYQLELDGKLWWERREALRGSKGSWPRIDPNGYYTTWYLPTKAMKKRGYKSTKTYWFKRNLE